MRLRPRSSRPAAEGWVQPRGAGRWTTIGNLDSARRGAVDPAGLVTVGGAGWSLDWWVGADDRWHLASQEVAVRQSLVGAAPVVETRLRIPGGDAVHRAWAARGPDGAEIVIVEVENASSVPFALALALRPHDQTGRGRIRSVELVGTEVRVDGEVALVLPKAPGRAALGDASVDSAAVVLAGDAGPAADASVTCRAGLAQAALLFPLAHTATLRVALPLPPAAPGAPLPDLAALPGADQVAAGWGSHVAGAARVELPDRRLRDGVAASARHLLLGGQDPAAAEALTLLGLGAAAARRLVDDPTALGRHPRPGAALHALARHWELTHDVDVARAAVPHVAALVARLRRSRGEDQALGHAALGPVAALLDAAGERRAADDLRAASERLGTGSPDAAAPPPAAEAERELGRLLGSAGSTWAWPGTAGGHDVDANAAFVTHVRALLVDDRGSGVDLHPIVPQPWLGQGWEVHDLPTRHGRLSWAVRWHGERPALLWQLDRHDPSTAVPLAAPGLDPAWSSADASGEALLAPAALPAADRRRGLTIPVAIEPISRRRT